MCSYICLEDCLVALVCPCAHTFVLKTVWSLRCVRVLIYLSRRLSGRSGVSVCSYICLEDCLVALVCPCAHTFVLKTTWSLWCVHVLIHLS